MGNPSDLILSPPKLFLTISHPGGPTRGGDGFRGGGGGGGTAKQQKRFFFLWYFRKNRKNSGFYAFSPGPRERKNFPKIKGRDK